MDLALGSRQLRFLGNLRKDNSISSLDKLGMRSSFNGWRGASRARIICIKCEFGLSFERRSIACLSQFASISDGAL